MKFRYVFAGAFLALSVLATGQAKAALFIPTYTIDSDLGTVVAGDNGVLENTFRLVYPGRYQDYNFTGTLDGKTRITFDYTLTGPDTSYLESVMGSLGASVCLQPSLRIFPSTAQWARSSSRTLPALQRISSASSTPFWEKERMWSG